MNEMFDTVECVCGEEIAYDWQPDERGYQDLVTCRALIRDGAAQLLPVDRCKCGRLLTYQWLAGAMKHSREERAVA